MRINNLVERGEKVAVAVSGGKDSLALLNILKEANIKLDLIVLSIDEGIAGYRDLLLPNITKFCKENSLEHYIFSMQDEYGIKTDDLSSYDLKYCTYCGVFRRILLNKKARELSANKLAIGHNLDDEIQTYFLNILRGDTTRFTRVASLYPAKNPKFVPKIKPLRIFLEREVLIYSILSGFKIPKISCPYSHTAMRNYIREFLDKIESNKPGTKNVTLNSFDKLSEKLFPHMKSIEIGECTRCGEPSSNKICKACELLDNLKK